ncbi:MAG: transposase [Cyanobacteria bacterium P01_A01_bin.114]
MSDPLTILRPPSSVLRPPSSVLPSSALDYSIRSCTGKVSRVSIVNPRAVRDLAKGLGTRAETDALDAQIIAKYGEVTEPPATVFASETEAELKSWVTRRQQLVEILTAEKNRRQQVRGLARDEVSEPIDWLKEQIKKIDETIKQLSESTMAWRERKALLQSPKGIGLVILSSLSADSGLLSASTGQG